MTDPLSLAQAKRLAGNADTLLLRATRAADLETPIGAFLRLENQERPFRPGTKGRAFRGATLIRRVPHSM